MDGWTGQTLSIVLFGSLLLLSGWLIDWSLIDFILVIWRRLEKKFDLYYYDGLARQDEEIRLTVGKDA